MLPKGGVGMATVLAGRPAGMFIEVEGAPSAVVDVIASELGPRGCDRSLFMAKGLGR